MNVRGGELFSKQMRLRKRSEYLRVQSTGRKVHTKAFLGIAVFGTPNTRIGVTTTKRIGCASERNRIKRLVKEAFRRSWMVVPKGAEVVVIAKRQAAGLDNKAVVEELSLLGRRLEKVENTVLSCDGLLSP